MPRIGPAVVAGGTLAAGLGLFWAAHGPIRGFGGDVLVVVFLDAALATVSLGTPLARLGAVGLLSVGLESLQGLHLVGPDAHWLVHLILGSTFDPLDLAAYAIGLGIAAALEQRWHHGR
ncbi:MAG: DUF2809 domain-containing protein [Myxococcota bacterium]